MPSSNTANTYGWLGQFPTLREWVGDRVLKDMAAQAYAVQNKLYEGTVGVKRTDIEDDNVGVYAPLFAEMGRDRNAAVNHYSYPEEPGKRGSAPTRAEIGGQGLAPVPVGEARMLAGVVSDHESQ